MRSLDGYAGLLARLSGGVDYGTRIGENKMNKAHPARAIALAAALLCQAASAHAEDATLEGAAAWRTLVGNTVVATTKNGSYTEYYAPDGAVRRLDRDGATAGRWTQADDGVCLDYPDDDDRICLRVTVRGSLGAFTDADGTADRFEILAGNAKDL